MFNARLTSSQNNCLLLRQSAISMINGQCVPLLCVFIQMNPLRSHLWHNPYLWQSIYGSLHIAIFFYIEQWVHSWVQILESSKWFALPMMSSFAYFPWSLSFIAVKGSFSFYAVSVFHSWLYIISLFSGLAVLWQVVSTGCARIKYDSLMQSSKR